MLRSGAPTQLTQVFAGGSGAGPTNVVPLTPTGSQPAGQIAYSTGFTSTNMTPIASGGVAPWGADMNGLLKAQTQAQIYQQAGFLYPYSSAFSTAMSGYPAGAVLPMASGLGLWLNQTDGNTTDPDSSGASGWVPQPANQGVTALTGLTGGTVVLTPNQLGAPFITLAGTLTSNLQVTLPLSAGRTYTIQNNTTGSYTVTVAGATGTGVTIAQGAANGTTVYTDGTNWYTGQFNGSGVYLPIAGTAVAATKLATARTIAMTGDVSWTSPAFDGTANVTAAGTIAAGAVTLAKMASFQANSLMGNPTSSAATPAAITLGSGLQFSSSQLQLAPNSAQVIGWLGYTPINKAGDTMSGALTINPVPLGTTAGSYFVPFIFEQSVSSGANTDNLVIQHTRTANGTDWTATNISLYRKVDSTVMGGIQFGEVASGTGLAFQSGGTTYGSMSGAGAWSFNGRPAFGTGTPWDSGNFNPANYLPLTGGTLTGTLTISRGSGIYNALVLTNSSGVEVDLNANGNTEGNLRTVTNHPLTFMTNNTLRLTLDTTGNATFTGLVNAVGAAFTAPLAVSGSGVAPLTLTSTSTVQTYLGVANTSTSGRSWYMGTAGSAAPTGMTVGDFFIYDATTGAWRQRIDSSGNAYFAAALTATGAITASSYNTSSDETLKGGVQRNVAPRDLTTVPMASWESLRGLPVTGRGLIAQDLQREFSEYVGVAPDNTLGVDYGRAALEQAWFNRGRLRAIEAYLGMEA